MPIVTTGRGPILRCINDVDQEHATARTSKGAATTMTQRGPGEYFALPGAEEAGGGMLSTGRGVLVRAFTCELCGYVELYDAKISQREPS